MQPPPHPRDQALLLGYARSQFSTPSLPWGWPARCQGGHLHGCLLPRRALKTRGNTPKYGLIFHSTFIGRAAAKNKGRISRYLANKCTIASRIDCFSGGLQNLPEHPPLC